MNNSKTPAFDAVLAQLNSARERICRGTAGVERLREELYDLGIDPEVETSLYALLEKSLQLLYEGAAAMQYVRPIIMEDVKNCEILLGSLRRKSRAARRDEPDDIPFPDSYFESK